MVYTILRVLFTLALFTYQSVWADEHTTEKKEPIPDLPSGYGYLVLDTEVHRLVTDWKLTKRIIIKDIPKGHHVRLLPLKAGTYHWQSINAPLFTLPFRLSLTGEKNKRWGFEIEKDKINYIGRLMVGENRATNTLDVTLINRLSMTHEYMQKEIPEIFEIYPMVYSGYLKDDFTTFFKTNSADRM